LQQRTEVERVLLILSTPGSISVKHSEYSKLAQLEPQAEIVDARVLSAASQTESKVVQPSNTTLEETKDKGIEAMDMKKDSSTCDQCSSGHRGFAQLFCSHWVCLECTTKNIMAKFQAETDSRIQATLNCHLCYTESPVRTLARQHCDCALDVASESAKAFSPTFDETRIALLHLHRYMACLCPWRTISAGRDVLHLEFTSYIPGYRTRSDAKRDLSNAQLGLLFACTQHTLSGQSEGLRR
jgi:hypothetical protein